MALSLSLGLQEGSPQYYVFVSLSVVGAISILGSFARLLGWLWRHFLRPAKTLSRYGSWALITGCTDGIGKAYAFLLAKHRINLILVGRSKEKLDTLVSEIKERSGDVKVKTVVLDLTHPDLETGLSTIKQLVSELDVGILINSAGLSYPYARFFHEVDEELTKNLLRMNVEAIVRMVQIVLPGMIERKRGAIINIGSGASSILPSEPLYALYAATKGFVEKFSRNLYVEYKSKGIDVQCQAPLYVATKLASIRKSSFFCPSPGGYARSGIRWIGYEPVCTPYWPHSVIWKVISELPTSVFDSVRMKLCLAIRAKGKAKDARKKEQ